VGRRSVWGEAGFEVHCTVIKKRLDKYLIKYEVDKVNRVLGIAHGRQATRLYKRLLNKTWVLACGSHEAFEID
jgi:hypothetical protein